MNPFPTALTGLAIACCVALAASPGRAADPAPAGQDPALTTALVEIDRLMANWSELQTQTIVVKGIAGLAVAAADGTRSQLEERLKSLLTKKRSNREWDAYWQSQAELTDGLLAAYAAVAPPIGEGLLDAEVARLRTQSKAAAATLAATDRGTRTAEDRVAAERAALDGVLATTREGLPELDAAIPAKLEIFTAKSEPIARLEARAAAPGAGPAAAQALAAARTALATASDALETARDAATTAHGIVDTLTALLGDDAEAPPLLPSAPDEVQRRVASLKEARAEIAAATVSAAGAREAATRAAAEFERAASLQQGFRARRPALAAWGALGHDKTANQDLYLTAINAEIASVEERLRGMVADGEAEAPLAAASVCEAERVPNESPFEHYNACVRATKEEQRARRAAIDDLNAATVMNARQAESLETLATAQKNDVQLAQREFAIARAESERATTSDEVEDWQKTWATYRERAAEKEQKLEDALNSTKDTRRTLTVNAAFFESEKIAINVQLAGLDQRLAGSSSVPRFLGALAESAWIFIKNAYMVPVFLLLAWLLLRLFRRIEKRLVTSAKTDARDRDEIQRIDTLAVVARGAIRLVVFIATSLLCLDAIGVDIGPILGGAAIFGLAISFGSQSLVKDFVTGFFILLENQYAVGDVIEAGGNTGTVEQITMRRTVLRDLQGRVHHIPNGSVNTVINTTQGWACVLSHIGVSYGTDLDLVETTVNAVGDALFADAEWKPKLHEPPRYIGLTEFGDSALVVRTMFRTAIFEQWAAEREFNRRIKVAFEQAGIGIPFPQRDLHLISVPPQLVAQAPAIEDKKVD